MKFFISCLLVSIAFSFAELDTFCQQKARFWVQFTNKDANLYLLDSPEKVLSERSIKRRLKNNTPFVEADLPVYQKYIDSLSNMGIMPLYTSKWFNSATVVLNSLDDTLKIQACSFVKKVEQTSDETLTKSSHFNDKNSLNPTNIEGTLSDAVYGYAYSQIILENGTSLHNKDFRGAGVQIAIIDVGFLNADKYTSLDKARLENRILGERDFVQPGNNVYNTHSHGAAVLSIIGADLQGKMVGTAPDASYWLLRSENSVSEYPVEEDNWIAAAEFADSVGVDIINTSLGYTEFDNPKYNHTYSTLNGVSTRMSLAASIAVTKGIVVVNSAGNDGVNIWRNISVPADAFNILAIGATNSIGQKAGFSSFGPSADGRIKPDVSAMGANDYYEGEPGKFYTGSGTSFSGPVITGLTACLIQAFPNVTAIDIMNTVKKSASRYNNPNDSIGYGIPDYDKAYNYLNDSFIKNNLANNENGKAFPNPFSDEVQFILKQNKIQSLNIECWSIDGHKMFSLTKVAGSQVDLSSEIQNISDGIYFFKFRNSTTEWSIKAVKNSVK